MKWLIAYVVVLAATVALLLNMALPNVAVVVAFFGIIILPILAIAEGVFGRRS